MGAAGRFYGLIGIEAIFGLWRSLAASGKILRMERQSQEPETETGTDSPAKEEVESREPKEIGGRDGPDPTRYGDWEKNGRCIDF